MSFSEITSGLFAHYCSNNVSRTTMVAKFTQVDTLPCAEVETAVGDGDGEASTEEGALGVGRHVIGSLHGMGVVGLILAHQMVHDVAEVGTYIRVGILIDS